MTDTYPFVKTDLLTADESNLLAESNRIQMTAGDTINGATLPVPCYFNDADNEIYAADADDIATTDPYIGFAITNSTDGNSIIVQTGGVVSGFSGLTEGAYYYIQGTAGTIGTAVGTVEKCVGVAISETEINMDLKPDGMEYISSASDSGGNNLTAPAEARFAIIYIDLVSGASVYADRGDVILSKVGKTTSRFTGTGDGAGGGPKNDIQFSWAGTTITVTLNAGGTDSADYTAYFYR